MLPAVAWLGGVLFVASLGYFLYFYGVVLGRPAPGGAPVVPAALFDLTLFTIFAVHHSVMARTGVKRWLTAHLPAEAERTAYVWAASALFLAVCLLWQPLPGVLYRAEGPLRWLLLGVQLGGVLLTWRAASMIDPLGLAGIRQARGDWRAGAFRVVGPFSLVRHPIYLGWMLMVFGAPAMTTSRLVFAAVSSSYLLMAIPWEERSLVTERGDAYRAYRRQVRWRILPGVW